MQKTSSQITNNILLKCAMTLGKFRINEQHNGGYVGCIEPADEKNRGWIIWLNDDDGGTAEIWKHREENGGQIGSKADVVLNSKPRQGKMDKTSAQIAEEVLEKAAKFPFRPAAQKYVTQVEMSAAKDRALSQLKPASKTEPSSMPTEHKSLSEIPVWPHKKTASQIGDAILKKLSFQGRMGFEANAAGAATGPAAPAAPAPAVPKPPTPVAAPMPKTGSSRIADAVLKKLAEGEQLDEQYYEDTPSRKRHWPLGVAGLLAGGAAAHYLAPSEMTKSYRGTAKGLEEPAKASLEAHKPSYDPKLDKFTGTLPEEHMTHIKDVSAAGRPVRFNAPAHAAQKYFKSRAWAESMPRTLGGAGLGLGAGLLASSLF